jgi:hypothetical protein
MYDGAISSGCAARPIGTRAPEPVLTLLSLRGQAREMTRYQEDEAHLQGPAIGEISGRAAAFLKLAAAHATEPLAAPGQLSETSRSASDAW